MLGLMQDWPLTLDRIIAHARTWHGETEVVSRSIEGPILRSTYGQIHERARRLSRVLLDLGVQPGDRVGAMALNTGRHLEVWYGVMGIGAVCHTLNPRMSPDQICYIINHAEDRIIFCDAIFLPILHSRRDQMPSVQRIIALNDEDYEPLIAAAAPGDLAWGGFDENTAAGLCYTSGTTGEPKGVLYSHRSNFLHTFATMSADVMGVSSRDVVLPVVPMFHANAWGLAFSGPAAGAKLVMPGAKLDGASIFELLETEKVTLSAAVPTVFQMLLTYLRETGQRLTTLQRVVIGGAALPPALMHAFQDEQDVLVVHAWGMTETSPLGVVSMPESRVAALSPAAQRVHLEKQGRPPIGIELRIADETGADLPHDGQAVGRLMVRGVFVAGGYFRGEGGDILDDRGFFDTGDIATIDEYGFMEITDRAKDVIKSGGEWISSIEIENLTMAHPAVEIAAVVGAAHPKWDERPVVVAKLKPEASVDRAEILAFLEGKIPRWWTPDDVVFVDDIPLGPTGKVDKKLIRQRMAGYVLPTA
ncbi:long-chain-fatty-acid--CoA ligase [Phenylobacterium immobile]|uniref:long-chain-fatty-acid--CoA ligase n=1 Tax=Phenylobacterium immobile TaxID=21 RepID=UPI000B08DE75|nr:long-chain-fatty-acid--CoA ligase [Phenylobacterium immobile]